jgi:DNA-binding NtrC family response regulator
MAALQLLTGPKAGLRFEVTGEVIIGRSPSCAIALDDSKVSRRHVRLMLEEHQARVFELGSRNGTLVNGEKVLGEALLLPGDRLQVGTSSIVFEPSAKAALSEREVEGERHFSLEELLPKTGSVASLALAAQAIVSAGSEATILRRTAEELRRLLDVKSVAAMLSGPAGLQNAAVVGADKIEIPKRFAARALETREGTSGEGIFCLPLVVVGAPPFGHVTTVGDSPLTNSEMQLAAAIVQLCAQALVSVRQRSGMQVNEPVLVGVSKPFRRLIERARREATGEKSVILVGPQGSGRCQVARFIHAKSSRALGPLIVVECRHTPGELEELLFGYSRLPGLPPLPSALLRADGGALLLRDVDALPRQLAQALARSLKDRTVVLPSGTEATVDVRLLATSSAPLKELKSRGDIDPELGELLSGSEIEVPALVDRSADVMPILEQIVADRSRSSRRAPLVFSPSAKTLLTGYAWPKNVRELVGVGERLSLLYSATEVTALHLPPEIQGGEKQAGTLSEMVSRLERDAIAEALRSCRGKKIRAAEQLGISRPTLDKKIEEYNLIIEKRRV